MRMHPQLPIIQEHGCLALARIAFDDVQQLKVRHPNASEATYSLNETAHAPRTNCHCWCTVPPAALVGRHRPG